MLEIPGYYYDAEKGKFFKIEASHTAPSQASWSAGAVKQRKIENASQEEARRRAQLLRRHIRRHPLQRDIVSSGLLRREVDHGFVPEDAGVAAWAGGLQEKGKIPFAPSFASSRVANMPCFWVGDDVAYATLDEESIVGTYISTDENDRVTFGPDPRTGEPSRIPQFRREMVRCPQMSSIEYHEPTHKVLLTSREASHSCGLFVFSPVVEAGGSGERWLIGHASHYKRLSIRHSYGDEWIVHKCTPAPASSNLLCVVGTNGGVLRVNPNEDMEWIAPEVSPKGTKLPREIFDQDFQQSNHNVLLAGGRQPRLWITDLRTPDDEWTYIRHNSSIAHLRSVNPNQVLVAGLENQMSLYDMRYYSKRSDVARPLLKFAEYNNAAHFHTGWDVCTELGAVAAAQDDGTVKLFSLKTGRRVRSRVVDAVKTDTPVKALKFKTTEGEGMPSLWVGEGLTLRKLSFGVKEFGDEA